MADAPLDPLVIKRTQEVLGKYVKKPALSEKLLKKPPFRFLHDIVNAIIKTTGDFSDLYSPEELSADNIKDRDAKMSFLQKLIDVVKLSTNVKITVRASKIVAGHEPEKTNELLQLIGKIIEEKIDCKDAIEAVKREIVPSDKSKDKESKTNIAKDNKDTKNIRKNNIKEKTKEVVKEKSTKKLVKSSSVEKDKVSKKTDKKISKAPTIKKESSIESSKNSGAQREDLESEKKKVQQSKKLTDDPNLKDDKVNKPKSLKDSVPTNSEDVSESRKSSSSSRRSSVPSNEDMAIKQLPIDVEKPLAKIAENELQPEPTMHAFATIPDASNYQLEASALPPDVTNSNIIQKESPIVQRESLVRQDSKEMRPRTSLRPPSARPASARPGAPRRRDKNVDIVLQPNDQIKLGGVNVKIEAFNADLEDDGENLVVIENLAIDGGQENEGLQRHAESSGNGEQQAGHLVQQILETQKELLPTHDEKSKRDVDQQVSQKRQSSAKQMGPLRDVIQNLTKSINPLGKLMEFIPEDIDAMQLELTMWKDSYNQAATELRKEKSLTESSTEPMRNQLLQIEANIKDYAEMIDASRAKILQNSEKLYFLLIEQ